ncbi:hypothetical protein PFISCL1PPCAC_8309, partial [Pristionchus fissidentatus]
RRWMKFLLQMDGGESICSKCRSRSPIAIFPWLLTHSSRLIRNREAYLCFRRFRNFPLAPTWNYRRSCDLREMH